MNRIIISIWLLLLLPFSFAVAQDTLNRLKGDIRVHDPVMIRENKTYYVFHTGRGISVKTSTDRVHWKRDSSVFDMKALPPWFTKDIPEQKGHLWAPDIH